MASWKNIAAELREILSSTVVVRRGSRSQSLSLLSAIVVTQADKALRGNDRAAKAVLDVSRWPGVLDGSCAEHSIDINKLTYDELDVLERLIAKSHIPLRDAVED
ncbi:hypothetical protein [Bradyrhizobium sp. 1(2017)]|uniref:hypothetical protein n=1 Tax=Bradyrhizobium sp. 1(2017) TaxID=1404888 RepID=UPI00140F38E9|nr:hypothetical protein [Bradyrhizobium sp. 1(2017)]QIO32783.1 hypothetical protein HAP40_13730 [Bradyrhizobium sp. 1(2017)]